MSELRKNSALPLENQKALADRLFPVTRPSDEEDVELRNIPPEQRRLHTETADLTGVVATPVYGER
jgi:hypothetical protein